MNIHYIEQVVYSVQELLSLAVGLARLIKCQRLTANVTTTIYINYVSRVIIDPLVFIKYTRLDLVVKLIYI